MEENKKKNDFDEDFVDFPEEDFEYPEIEGGVEAQEDKQESFQEQSQEESLPEAEMQEASDKENAEEINKENSEETIETTEEAKETEIKTQEASVDNNKGETPEISHWEELKEDNVVVKKYIIHISKSYIDILDELSTEERSAYVNDAIQTKLNVEYEKRQKNKKVQYSIHFVIGVLTFLICLPIAILFVHKAIMATYNNYKYSQENFEKLYKTRFQKEKSYIRYIQLKLEGNKKAKDKD